MGLLRQTALPLSFLHPTGVPGRSDVFEKHAAIRAKPKVTVPTSTTWVSGPSDPNNAKIEAAIRIAAGKPGGELTKADLEKVTQLYPYNNQLTSVKGLEKLTQLTTLVLINNPALTKAQIAELQKALPKCRIFSNPQK